VALRGAKVKPRDAFEGGRKAGPDVAWPKRQESGDHWRGGVISNWHREPKDEENLHEDYLIEKNQRPDPKRSAIGVADAGVGNLGAAGEAQKTA